MLAQSVQRAAPEPPGVGEKCNFKPIPMTPNLWRGGPGIRDLASSPGGSDAPSSSRGSALHPLLGTALPGRLSPRSIIPGSPTSTWGCQPKEEDLPTFPVPNLSHPSRQTKAIGRCLLFNDTGQEHLHLKHSSLLVSFRIECSYPSRYLSQAQGTHVPVCTIRVQLPVCKFQGGSNHACFDHLQPAIS